MLGEDAAAEGIDLSDGHGLEPARSLQPQIEAADSSKEGEHPHPAHARLEGVGERNEASANSGDCSANFARLGAPEPQKSNVWPDGGVVTQRTANPLIPLENAR